MTLWRNYGTANRGTGSFCNLDRGLDGTLREMLSGFRKHHGLEVMEEIADLIGLFSDEVRAAVYRLFQGWACS
jgi:signal transduction histidine kinase